MRPLPATLSTVAVVVKRLLADGGPMTESDLDDALERSDLVLGGPADEILDELLDSAQLDLAVPLDGGRWAWLPGLVEGRTMTHRVTATELRHGILAVTPGLDVTLMVAGDATLGLDAATAAAMRSDDASDPSNQDRLRHLTDGSPVVTAFSDLNAEAFEDRGIATDDLDDLDDDEYLLLPPTLLPSLHLAAGDLVGVTLTPEGWAVERVPEEALHADPRRLREPVRAWFEGNEPADLPEFAWWLFDTTDAFTGPELPLTELLSEWGLVHRGDVVAREELDLDRWWFDRHAGVVARRHGLDDDHARIVVALTRLVTAADALLEVASAATTDDERHLAVKAVLDLVSDREQVVPITEALAVPDIAEALLAESLDTGRERAAALGLLAESLLPVASPSAHPALHWLVAKVYERTGDVVRAEAFLRTATDLEPWPPALRDLARYSSDRGNAAEAAALLRRSGVGRGDVELGLYEHFASMAATNLGRNKPCWCGSGRKYKVCHLGRELLPLDERAAWLYQKAGAYLNAGQWGDLVIGVATERARYSPSPEALEDALGDSLVADAVLVEGGAFEAFLAERGPLLPDDEVTLGQQWLLIDRSVHEVEAVRPGTSLTLRDIRTGDVNTVRERTASRTLQPGTLLCARVLPAGETMQLFGAVEPVPLHELDGLLALLDDEPDPTELVAFLSRRFAPPQLRNTEGEPLVFHEAELRVADAERLAAHLDELLIGDHEPGKRTWHATVGDGRDQIRAIVRLDGDTVQVETNSDERFERIMATLRDSGTTLEEVTHRHHTLEQMAELTERFPDLMGDDQGPSPTDLAALPEVAAGIADLMRRYEDEWLDEPIPAFSGLTPRQAVADPTRRGDVVRLLRSWPEPTPVTMGRDRIAGLLGLTL